MAAHFSWVTIATIPIYTIGTFIVFRKQGYNFFEFFVLNTFKASQRLFIQILIFPILLYLSSRNHAEKFSILAYVLGIIMTFWTNIQFFNKVSKTKAFLLTLLSHIIFLTCFFVLVAIILLLTGKINDL